MGTRNLMIMIEYGWSLLFLLIRSHPSTKLDRTEGLWMATNRAHHNKRPKKTNTHSHATSCGVEEWRSMSARLFLCVSRHGKVNRKSQNWTHAIHSNSCTCPWIGSTLTNSLRRARGILDDCDVLRCNPNSAPQRTFPRRRVAQLFLEHPLGESSLSYQSNVPKDFS